MLELLKKQWWFIIGPVALACLAFIWPSWWFISIAILIVVLYLLFWAVQFAGVTQLEQNKMLFQKMAYEIDGRQILMKISERQGMPVTWDMIKTAKKGSDHYLLSMSKAQFIYLPFSIFTNPNDLRMMDTYLRRKNLLAPETAKPVAG
ncbi:MAG TPA: YcxB family protein [Adhaeribacter sp.]|nr:YcxB family protein [Adhaeribacter sp.]